MKIAVLDTETTGLTNYDEVVQVAGILFDTNLDIIDVTSFYCKPQRKISEGASNVHCITNANIDELSGGRHIGECIKGTFLEGLEDTLFVFYNAKFDVGKLNTSCIKNTGNICINFGTEVNEIPTSIDGNKYFCLMKNLPRMLNYEKKKWVKLEEAYNKEFDLGSKHIQEWREYLGKVFNLPPSTVVGAHDALYDVLMTNMLLGRVMGLA